MEDVRLSDTLAKEIGLRIRSRREELRLTREDLAENAELSFQFLADVETGRSNMTTVTLYKLARALNLSCDYIVFGTGTPQDTSEVNTLLASLSAKDRKLAEETLRNFVAVAKKK